MTPEQERLLHEIKDRLDKIEKSDRYTFEKSVSIRGKVGFYGVQPVARPADGAGRSDITLDAGGTAHVGTTYTGNTGTTDYSVGDIVYALKAYGLLT